MRDTWSLITELVKAAGSLEEAKQLVDAEIKKGDCFIISQSIIDQRIESLWQGKIRAMERMKERYSWCKNQ